MAIVILGGLVTSGIIDVLLLPSLFLSLGVSSARELDVVLDTRPDRVFGPAFAPSGGARD